MIHLFYFCFDTTIFFPSQNQRTTFNKVLMWINSLFDTKIILVFKATKKNIPIHTKREHTPIHTKQASKFEYLIQIQSEFPQKSKQKKLIKSKIKMFRSLTAAFFSIVPAVALIAGDAATNKKDVNVNVVVDFVFLT